MSFLYGKRVSNDGGSLCDSVPDAGQALSNARSSGKISKDIKPNRIHAFPQRRMICRDVGMGCNVFQLQFSVKLLKNCLYLIQRKIITYSL